MYKESWVK